MGQMQQHTLLSQSDRVNLERHSKIVFTKTYEQGQDITPELKGSRSSHAESSPRLTHPLPLLGSDVHPYPLNYFASLFDLAKCRGS